MLEHEHQESTTKTTMNTSLWRKLLSYALAYPWTFARVVIFGMGTALGEIGITVLIRPIVDNVSDPEGSVLLPGIAFAITTVLMCGCILGFIRATGKLKAHVSHDLRRDGFANLQQLSFSFYDQHSVGWLMARMTSDTERLAVIMTWGILEVVWGVTMIVGMSIACFILDAGLAALMLSVLPIVVVFSLWFQKRILKVSRKVRKTNSKITAAFSENLSGVATTKTFTRERANSKEFGELTDSMYEVSIRNAQLNSAFLPLIHFMGSVALALALAKGGIHVSLGTLSFGTLMTFLTAARYLMDPIQEMARLFSELQTAQASGERIVGLIETEPEIRDAPGLAPVPPGTSVGEIEFRDVSFAYTDDKSVLENFSLKVRSGETIAIVGPTGGGKTTLTALLCRFYEPTSGSITIDGVDLQERPLAWLQERLGIVLQEPHLFSGSILENIRYGCLEATDEQVREAARTVGAEEFILGLESGYATEVGEQGTKLSIGQKQLVSFARALLRDPEILVMDEATSSIDTETELHIQKALRRILVDRTTFVIAHRLSTIREADRILVLEEGRVVESGDHASLLLREGAYARLYRRSLGQVPLATGS